MDHNSRFVNVYLRPKNIETQRFMMALNVVFRLEVAFPNQTADAGHV